MDLGTLDVIIAILVELFVIAYLPVWQQLSKTQFIFHDVATIIQMSHKLLKRD